MDAPIRELEALHAHQDQAQHLLEAGHVTEALAEVEAALAIEPENLRSLNLKASALERSGDNRAAEAAQLRDRIKALKHELWERQVEAEIRGRHDLMGTAIRHEKL